MACSTNDNSIVAIPVNHGNLNGYLIAGSETDKDQERIFPVFCELVFQKSSADGSAPIPLSADFQAFKNWATANEFGISQAVGGKNVFVGYISADALPELTPVNGYSKADLENWLEPESRLFFDVFLHMPANNKHLRYFKKDSLITQDLLRQYTRLGTSNLMIQSEDHQAFIAYCLQTALSHEQSSTEPSSNSNVSG